MKDTTAFVLAGGLSSRMGVDKGLLEIGGKPMFMHIVEILATNFSNVIVISNNIESYSQYYDALLPDIYKHKGPMGGIHTALFHATTKNIFVVSCDMPLLNQQTIDYFINRCDEDVINVARVGEKVNPLFCLYPKHCEHNLNQSILDEKLKVVDFIESQSHKIIDMTDFNMNFANINTPDDYKQIIKK